MPQRIYVPRQQNKQQWPFTCDNISVLSWNTNGKSVFNDFTLKIKVGKDTNEIRYQKTAGWLILEKHISPTADAPVFETTYKTVLPVSSKKPFSFERPQTHLSPTPIVKAYRINDVKSGLVYEMHSALLQLLNKRK